MESQILFEFGSGYPVQVKCYRAFCSVIQDILRVYYVIRETVMNVFFHGTLNSVKQKVIELLFKQLSSRFVKQKSLWYHGSALCKTLKGF